MIALKNTYLKPCHRAVLHQWTIRLSMCCVVILVGASRLQAEAPPVAKLRLFTSAAGLVRAQVTETDETKDEWITIFTIARVFWGPKEMTSQQLRISTPKNVRDGTHNIAFIGPAKVGERAIWAVNVSKGKVLPGNSLAYFTALPVRESEVERFRFVEQFAEVLAEIESLPVDEQLPKLERHALHKVPDVSYWAISVLSDYYRSRRSQRHDWRAFLGKLVKSEGLCVAGRVAVDEVSCSAFGQEWRDSPLRLELLRSCVQSKTRREEADCVMTWLGRLATTPRDLGIEQDELVALVKTAVSNEGWPIEVRTRFTWVIRATLKSFTDDTVVFKLLAEIVREIDHPEVRREAAAILCWPNILKTEARHRVVLELLRVEKDQRVLAILQEGAMRFENAQSNSDR